MNAFLAETRTVYQNIILNPQHYAKLRVVLGNESCDLDSAISALVYGFILHHQFIEDCAYRTAVLPLFNIPHDDLPLKTEVTYFLKANGINMDWAPTRGARDLLDLVKVKDAGSLEVTLVDHHTLSSNDEELRDCVVEVIDHRPQHPQWTWQGISSQVKIQPVGSCATLVAQKIRETNSHLITKEVAKLLLGPILLDTVNLSESAGRATPLDEEIVQYLEGITTVDRQQTYLDLVKAKADVANLLTSQLLRKDLKFIAGVPVAGVPLLVQDMKSRPDFGSSLALFARLLNQVPVVVVMGVLIEGEEVKRDLAVFGRSAESGVILKALLDSKEPELQLEEVTGHGIADLRLFQQGNRKATRKHIGPIIAKAAAGCEAIQKCGLD